MPCILFALIDRILIVMSVNLNCFSHIAVDITGDFNARIVTIMVYLV